MPTNRDVQISINELTQEVNKCLARCQAAPGPSAERYEQLSTFRSAVNNISNQLESMKESAIAPEREKLKEPQLLIAQKNEEVKQIQQEQSRVQLEHQRQVRELQQLAQKDASAQKQLTEFHRQSPQIQAEIQSRLSLAQQEVNQLHNITNELNLQISHAQQKWLSLEATNEALQLPQQAKDLLDSAGLYERNITRSKEVEERAAVDFESKATEFQTAADYHRKQAVMIFWTMAVTVVMAAFVIIVLFLGVWSSFVPPLNTPTANDRIERAILVGVGRIAILFFFAWALRYLGSLHKSHSEQAVLYLDRKAALGVAANMLRASPELEQKRQLLQTLARGYLDFEQNAFRVGIKQPIESSDIDLKQLRKLTQALQPLLDTIKSVGEKPK